MKHSYNIEGMTCNGCRTDVENAINKIKGVSALVDLEKEEVVLEMKYGISLNELQNALPNKYTISQKKVSDNDAIPQIKKSDLQQLFPLFLILGYIAAVAVLLNYKTIDYSGFMLDFMGMFYIVFSFFKFLDLNGFPDSFSKYDPLAKKIPIYGRIYPFIELVTGLLFLIRWQLGFALIITVIILGITTIGVVKVLLDKKSIQCACLGTVLKLPMTKATFIENSIMLIMAIIMLFVR